MPSHVYETGINLAPPYYFCCEDKDQFTIFASHRLRFSRNHSTLNNTIILLSTAAVLQAMES